MGFDEAIGAVVNIGGDVAFGVGELRKITNWIVLVLGDVADRVDGFDALVQGVVLITRGAIVGVGFAENTTGAVSGVGDQRPVKFIDIPLLLLFPIWVRIHFICFVCLFYPLLPLFSDCLLQRFYFYVLVLRKHLENMQCNYLDIYYKS